MPIKNVRCHKCGKLYTSGDCITFECPECAQSRLIREMLEERMTTVASRISRDEMFLQMCFILALRGTCKRRKVGCIFTDVRGHIISSGYNGNAAGQPHCIDSPCPGVGLASGTGLDECEAIHAEQNAMIQCRRPFEIETVYCTDSPCIPCLKLLMGTSARRIVFAREYPHPKSKNMWMGSGEGKEWIHLEIEPLSQNWPLIRISGPEYQNSLL